MKTVLMRSSVLGLILAVLFVGRVLAGEDEHGLTKEVDGITVELSFADETARTGGNEAMVALTGGDGKPIAGATVLVSAEMAGAAAEMAEMGHAGTPPPQALLAEPQAGHGEGRYMAKLDFSDEGEWTVKLNIAAGDRKRLAEFAVHVENAGPNWYVIGGFLGVIGAIIAAAALKKMRKTAVHPEGAQR